MLGRTPVGPFREPKRASIVIASHNEGAHLLKTVCSVLETVGRLDCEVIVADDASSDGSTAMLRRLFPTVRQVASRKRRGCSFTKHLGARKSAGRVLVFVDAHCRPEPQAIERLVNDVEDLHGQAIVTPQVPSLDTETWENSDRCVGHGFAVRLEDLGCGWIPLREMRPWGRFYESPALVGCCLAVSRDLYRKARGFDQHMADWGAEDIDFGLKAWFLGYSVLHDPFAVVGHRFRKQFDNYSVAPDAVRVNELRTARKNLGDRCWDDWVSRKRSSMQRESWEQCWRRFSRGRGTVEKERAYLLARRVRDEYRYAAYFGLAWPRG